jgi:hypothetical protein
MNLNFSVCGTDEAAADQVRGSERGSCQVGE